MHQLLQYCLDSHRSPWSSNSGIFAAIPPLCLTLWQAKQESSFFKVIFIYMKIWWVFCQCINFQKKYFHTLDLYTFMNSDPTNWLHNNTSKNNGLICKRRRVRETKMSSPRRGVVMMAGSGELWGWLSQGEWWWWSRDMQLPLTRRTGSPGGTGAAWWQRLGEDLKNIAWA